MKTIVGNSRSPDGNFPNVVILSIEKKPAYWQLKIMRFLPSGSVIKQPLRRE
jgi:hypothetical protein